MAVVVLAIILVQAVLMNGICLCKRPMPGQPGKGAVLMTIDVCGKGAFQASVTGFETINCQHNTCYNFKTISVFPPDRAPADASADPGDVDKPPEA